MIKKNSPVLLLRYNTYQDFDFVKTHSEILKAVGSVWLLKLGKQIPESSLNTFLENDGNIILKAPKKKGGYYHYAHMIGYHVGKPSEDMIYPDYYRKMVRDSYEYTLCGSWIKIDYLELLDFDVLGHFYLIKNGKPMVDIINSTRTATLYVESDEDITIGAQREWGN